MSLTSGNERVQPGECFFPMPRPAYFAPLVFGRYGSSGTMGLTGLKSCTSSESSCSAVALRAARVARTSSPASGATTRAALDALTRVTSESIMVQTAVGGFGDERRRERKEAHGKWIPFLVTGTCGVDQSWD